MDTAGDAVRRRRENGVRPVSEVFAQIDAEGQKCQAEGANALFGPHLSNNSDG